MATTMKGGDVGKKKRVTSPSNSTIKRSPKPLSSTKASSSSSSSSTATKTSSTSEIKYVPNYLRPTVCSINNGHSKIPTRTSLDKPRRSFDRSPRNQRTTAPTTHDVKTLRSSSFSNKTTTGPLIPSISRRPSTSTSVSSRKVVKGAPQASKPQGGPRKNILTTNTTTKKETPSSSKKGHEKTTIEETRRVRHYETRSEGHIMTEDHEFGRIGNESESIPETSDTNERADDHTSTEIELKPPVQEDHIEIDTGDEHHQEGEKLVVDDKTVEETTNDQMMDRHPDKDTKKTVEETTNDQIQIMDKHQDEDTQKTIEETTNEQIQMMDKHQDQDTQKTIKETTNDQIQIDGDAEEGAVENNVPEHTESNAEHTDQTIIKEEKSEEPINKDAEVDNNEENMVTDSSVAATSTAAKSQPAGKKEKQVYNNVIEETATKLRSKKNKVLALAGAFETVISLEDTNNKN